MPSDVGAHDAPSEPARAPEPGWRIPFWALQVLELGTAFLLVTQSVHVGHGGILVAAGAALAVLALTADGPLGIFRLCGQRLHIGLVVGLSVAMVAAAAIPSARPDVQGLLVIALAVLALVVLSFRTATPGGRTRGTPGTRDDGIGRTGITDATDSVAHGHQPPPSAPPPPVTDDVDSAVRRAGRTTGGVAAAGKRAVDQHRPRVEDQVKRGLRSAGRLAGRLTEPKAPPDDVA